MTVLFRGEHTNRDTCPDCGESRYINQGTPARHFTYLPIGPRLIRLFGTQNLAKIVQAYGLHLDSSKTYIMYDIHDSLAWRLAYSSDGPYSSEYQSISFAFNTDGFNPYSQIRCGLSS